MSGDCSMCLHISELSFSDKRASVSDIGGASTQGNSDVVDQVQDMVRLKIAQRRGGYVL